MATGLVVIYTVYKPYIMEYGIIPKNSLELVIEPKKYIIKTKIVSSPFTPFRLFWYLCLNNAFFGLRKKIKLCYKIGITKKIDVSLS